ncbi:MAG: hypothetical protein HFH16_01850 [Ruminococcus sp.]|jgi:acyl-CoA thioesterase-1|uniref:SGNH hydrolase-type esterase domain-containing protein n=1 Tax=Schaedlerella arabinosiphila TaxID=2044587 RepID=A0A3R8KVW4_9FIRM|nr:GDSL-type esterase/lipase family protein [Schaedlerella arabinosiphila]MCI8722451.1 hypothetical protein [Ruminococcus sp.]RRK30923.1 hypothetical protein EBB54_05675 [Schaedlerella arabinosiphila]
MKTSFKTPDQYAEAILHIADMQEPENEKQPLRFMKVMKENRGFINKLSPYSMETEDGLERKNPLIVVLGDSVTAGHFEFNGDMADFFEKLKTQKIDEDQVIEATDVLRSYADQFRKMLIEHYDQTAVSVINSGIAGDTMHGMYRRLERDVIRYQPDLVIINGSLNWGEEDGDDEEYYDVLSKTVQEVKDKTDADIILLTPNMELPGNPASNPHSSLKDRIKAIRRVAKEKDVCLADVYKIWETYAEKGYPLKELLANGINHPSIVGHTVYAKALMKLFYNV